MTTLALSSFWSSGRDWRPRDFFTAGVDLDFDCFELSEIHYDTFYDEIPPGDFYIVSLHDHAVANVPTAYCAALHHAHDHCVGSRMRAHELDGVGK